MCVILWCLVSQHQHNLHHQLRFLLFRKYCNILRLFLLCSYRTSFGGKNERKKMNVASPGQSTSCLESRPLPAHSGSCISHWVIISAHRSSMFPYQARHRGHYLFKKHVICVRKEKQLYLIPPLGLSIILSPTLKLSSAKQQSMS